MSANENNKTLKEFTLGREKEILMKYGIEDVNDPINVQKSIFNILRELDFYQVVVNDETGMKIEITKKGIKETFGWTNYTRTPKLIKLLKVDLLERIPLIIKSGHLDKKDYLNYHKENSELEYNYLYKEIIYYGYRFTIKCDIRKSKNKNQFWVHQIIFDIKK